MPPELAAGSSVTRGGVSAMALRLRKCLNDHAATNHAQQDEDDPVRDRSRIFINPRCSVIADQLEECLQPSEPQRGFLASEGSSLRWVARPLPRDTANASAETDNEIRNIAAYIVCSHWVHPQ